MSAAAAKQPVSVFNQAAEDRLKELLEKRKRDKLTRAEALEGVRHRTGRIARFAARSGNMAGIN